MTGFFLSISLHISLYIYLLQYFILCVVKKNILHSSLICLCSTTKDLISINTHLIIRATIDITIKFLVYIIISVNYIYFIYYWSILLYLCRLGQITISTNNLRLLIFQLDRVSYIYSFVLLSILHSCIWGEFHLSTYFSSILCEYKNMTKIKSHWDIYKIHCKLTRLEWL